MRRRRQNRAGRPVLRHVSGVQHQYVVRDVADYAQVVRYEDVGVAGLSLASFEQVQHLRLNGHVQRRYRLVRDDKLRVRRERAGERDPLLLPAAQLRGQPVQVLRIEADGLHEFLGALPYLASADSGELPESAGDGVPYRQLGIQRGGGVLEHHPHGGALFLGAVLDVALQRFAAQFEPAAVSRLQPDDGARGGALAGSALADYAEGASAVNAHIHVNQSADGLTDGRAEQDVLPAPAPVELSHILGVQHGRVGPVRFGLLRSRAQIAPDVLVDVGVVVAPRGVSVGGY